MKINKNLFIILILFIIILISYGNIFPNEFVWDDHIFILDNPEIKSLSNIPSFFTTDIDNIYRPVRSIHYTIVYSVFKKDPFGYHLNALFFHIIISILIYFIILKLIDKKNIAFLASLLFALHPIHTGRVTNMTAGFDLLGIFLFLLSFYFYIIFSQNKKLKYFIFSLVLFGIGLFASEEVATLPFVIILYEFCFNKNFFEKLKENILRFYAPFFVLLIGYIVIRFFVLGIVGRPPEYDSPGLFFTQITMAKVFVSYILLLIAPINLKLFHEVEVVTSFFNFDVLISIILLILILIFTIKKFNKVVFFCVFWFFITLLPFSNIIPLVSLMAERYVYLPSLGFCFLLAFTFVKIYDFDFEKKKYIRIFLVIFFILLLLSYSFVVVKRNAEWRDNITFWTETVKDSPNNSGAHDNLGFTYEHAGDIENALEEFEIAIKLQPDNYKALANIGVAYAKLGIYNESIASLKKSIKIKKYHKTYDKLGLVYVELNMENEAIESFKKAIKINPRYAKAHNDLGTVYGKIGKFDLALQEFNEAIRIDKDYADTHYNLGILLEFLEQDDLAKKEFEIAVRLEPDNEKIRSKIK